MKITKILKVECIAVFSGWNIFPYWLFCCYNQFSLCCLLRLQIISQYLNKCWSCVHGRNYAFVYVCGRSRGIVKVSWFIHRDFRLLSVVCILISSIHQYIFMWHIWMVSLYMTNCLCFAVLVAKRLCHASYWWSSNSRSKI